jgi:hypothetical protein
MECALSGIRPKTGGIEGSNIVDDDAHDEVVVRRQMSEPLGENQEFSLGSRTQYERRFGYLEL